MATGNKSTGWPVLIITIVASMGIGYFLGKMNVGGGEEPAGQTAEQPAGESGQAAAEGGEASASAATGEGAGSGVSAEQLAKDKGVPEKIESGQGDFILIAVIEGEDSNRALQGSLQVVNQQRQRLAQLSQQYNRTDPALSQQRELIAGQINETRLSLEQNLRFMAQNFGYTLANNYLLVPHLASLSSVIGEGKDQIKTLVYRFKDSDSYASFQDKTNAYSQLKIAQARAYREKQTDEEKKQPLPKLPLTTEMEKVRRELVDKYKCDPERNYLIDIQKSALYARRAQ